MHVPVSLSFSIYICKNVLDPDQTRMEFRKECFVNLKNCACDRKYAKCCTKADAHDKMGFQYISISVYIVRSHARSRGGGTGGPDPLPLKNHKNFLAILERIPRNSQNYQASIQRWAIIGTPAKRHLKAFRWRADDGPLLVIFGSSPLKKKKKTVVRVRIQIRSE